MAGGYVILTDTPLEVGENNMAEIYGSVEAANNRLYAVAGAGKPVLAHINTPNGVTACWFTYAGIAGTSLIMNSSYYTLSYDISNSVIKVTLPN